MEDLHGQHVVVTGATGPLGRVVTETLLACGATVSGVSRRRTALDALRAELRHHDRLHVAECDVTDGSGVERLFDALERGTGPVDGVVHCVGGFAQGSLAETTDDTIDKLYRALLLSPMIVTRAAIRRMVPRHRGRIVLIGSMASLKPAPGMAIYAAMKAAVGHFVQSIAAEVHDTDVRVNALLPGTLDTELQRKHAPDIDPARWVHPGTVAKAVAVLLGDSGQGVHGALITLPDRIA